MVQVLCHAGYGTEVWRPSNIARCPVVLWHHNLPLNAPPGMYSVPVALYSAVRFL